MLKIDGVHKRFGELVAVDGLSLHVRAGECVGLLGPNGAGKTTTMSMAVGVLRPDSGSIVIGGEGSPADHASRRHVGLAPQSLALYDTMTAAENLVFFAELYGVTDAKGRAGELLEMIGLSDRGGDRRGDRVGAFSGGMKRRLNLAAALVHDPPLVLLDEPTAGVDPQSRNAIFELVRTLRDNGKAIVYTTHYMEEAQRLCDRVEIVDRGRVLASGTVDELIGAHGGESVLTLERASGVERRPVDDPVRALAGVSLAPDGDDPVTGVRIDRPDLEAVFLNLTGRSLRDH
ncbi:MAG: ABC transporter ATP-binding protein [Planctomycetota bacterium]